MLSRAGPTPAFIAAIHQVNANREALTRTLGAALESAFNAFQIILKGLATTFRILRSSRNKKDWTLAKWLAGSEPRVAIGFVDVELSRSAKPSLYSLAKKYLSKRTKMVFVTLELKEGWSRRKSCDETKLFSLLAI